jgi:CubicO group peptidase (beta-lactamase class C family)
MVRERITIAAALLLMAACSEEEPPASSNPSAGTAGSQSVSGAAGSATSATNPPGSSAAAAGSVGAQPPPSAASGGSPAQPPAAQPGVPATAGTPGTATPPPGMMPTAPAPPTPAGVVFPGASWETKTPADAGFDAAKLETAAANLLTSLPGRQCFAVFRDGYLVYEKYYTGNEHTLNAGYSTSKSFGSTLVGMAVTQGLFKTDDLVKTLLPDSTVLPDVQIKHLLSMSGHLDPPGTKFDYAMGQMLLGNLANAITAKSGMPVAQFFEKNLRAPLEMQDIDWGDGRFISFAGNVSTTCRDGARLGHFWANNGTWKGQRLISEQYYNEATSAPFPVANAGYGYNFWLNVAFSRTKRVGKSFAAIGANAQYIVIIPELQLVITSYGNDPDDMMSGGPSIAGGVLDAML